MANTFSGIQEILGMYNLNPYVKRSKYGNKKNVVGNIVFDSKKESERYLELSMLEKAGIIQNLERQKRFEIIPKTQTERAAYYVADFVYFKDGEKIAEDVKSSITRKNPTYIIKRKLFKYRYPEYKFQEV